MAINLGFQTKYILNPWCMLFHPMKVPLKVSSILFKIHSACCVIILGFDCVLKVSLVSKLTAGIGRTSEGWRTFLIRVWSVLISPGSLLDIVITGFWVWFWFFEYGADALRATDIRFGTVVNSVRIWFIHTAWRCVLSIFRPVGVYWVSLRISPVQFKTQSP